MVEIKLAEREEIWREEICAAEIFRFSAEISDTVRELIVASPNDKNPVDKFPTTIELASMEFV